MYIRIIESFKEGVDSNEQQFQKDPRKYTPSRLFFFTLVVVARVFPAPGGSIQERRNRRGNFPLGYERILVREEFTKTKPGKHSYLCGARLGHGGNAVRVSIHAGWELTKDCEGKGDEDEASGHKKTSRRPQRPNRRDCQRGYESLCVLRLCEKTNIYKGTTSSQCPRITRGKAIKVKKLKHRKPFYFR